MAQKFQDKFKNQIQTIGKNGIAGTMENGTMDPMSLINNQYNQGFQGAISTVAQVNPLSQQGDPLSNWNQIYSNEQKSKGNKNIKKIPKGNSHIIKNGELIMKNNTNSTSSSNIVLTENEKRNNYGGMNQYQPQPQPLPQQLPQQMYAQMQMPMPMQMFQPQNPQQQMMGVGMNIMNNMNNQYQPRPQQINNMMNQFQGRPPIPLNPVKINNEPTKDSFNYFNNQKLYPSDLKRANSSSERGYSGRYRYVEYKPYTLKDYKELTRTGIVMGPLGANIGTKEWETKKEKMKRMESYSNRINQTHKGVTKLKKDTPKDEIEKMLKKKMEESNRFRTYEYGKLIRVGKKNQGETTTISSKNNSRLPNDYYYKDLGVINEDEEIKVKGNINLEPTIPLNKNDLNDDKNYIPLIKKTNQLSDIPSPSSQYNTISPIPEKINFLNENIPKEQEANQINISNASNNNLEQLLQQREIYKAKINDIKDSLL